MTDQVLVRKRRRAPEPRDLIFLGMAAVMLALFFSKALAYGLIGNLQILATTMATIGIVAAGQTVVVITGGVDLSVGSMVALTGIITAKLTAGAADFLPPVNPWLAGVLALIIATAIGWLIGTLIGHYKLAPFIVTFGALSLLRGAAQALSNGSPVNFRSDAFDWMWANLFGVIPVPVLLMLMVFIITAYMLRNSRFGRYAYAIGSNETVARLSGINTARMYEITYAVSAFLAGVAGLLIMTRTAGGIYGNGQGYELITIAAVIIGGTSLRGGTGGVWGTLAGILLISMVENGLVLFSVPALWSDTIVGAFIIGAALLDIQRRRVQESTPPPAPLPPLTPEMPAHTLENAIKHLAQNLTEHSGCHAVQVYLLDRETGSLVTPQNQSAPVSRLAADVSKTRQPLYVNDLRRDGPYQAHPIQPDMRSAAAIPILRQQRLVGVVEMQSRVSDAFAGLSFDSMIDAQLTGPIEDNWLLEGGWLSRQVRECLRSLSDEPYLAKSALGDWLLPPNETHNRGVILRDMLLEAGERLKPKNASPLSRSARRYEVLKQTFIDQKNADAIINDLGLSRRQYFYDLKEAVDAVSHCLVSLHSS